jgi:hypothetical protein
MNWDEIVKPIVLSIRQANKNRIEKNGPGMIGALDQDKMFFRELFDASGIKPTDYTARDLYMMISAVWMLWMITHRAEANGNIDERGMANVISASGTLAYGILEVLMPAWLTSDSDTAL